MHPRYDNQSSRHSDERRDTSVIGVAVSIWDVMQSSSRCRWRLSAVVVDIDLDRRGLHFWTSHSAADRV